MKLFDIALPIGLLRPGHGQLFIRPVCQARNENIKGASCEFVASGTGAHLCVRPLGHIDKMPPEIEQRIGLGDNHICECGVRWA